jgi:phage shock protein E
MVRRLGPAAALAVGAAILAVGCGGGQSSGATGQAATTSPRLVSVQQFADQVDKSGVVTINVHTPHDGDIAGTDLVIPFDKIASSTELPTDLSTPLAVYCRSGNMSATAVKVLADKGYTDIVELAGGYNAWIQSGRTLDGA